MVRLGQTASAADGKRSSLGSCPLVAEGPGYQHGHDDRLARTGRHLASQPCQRLQVRVRRRASTSLAISASSKRGLKRGPLATHADFGEVDHGFDCFHLAEEQPPNLVLAPPVAQELSGDVGGVSVARIPPTLHVFAQAIHVGQLFPVLLGEQLDLLVRDRAFRLEPVSGGSSPGRPGRFAGFLVIEPVLRRFFIRLAEYGLLHRLHRDLAGFQSGGCPATPGSGRCSCWHC